MACPLGRNFPPLVDGPRSDRIRGLVAANLGLDYHLARAYLRAYPALRGHLDHEIYEAADWGLLVAADKFDEGRGVRFSLYARRVILSKIRDALKVHNKRLSREADLARTVRGLARFHPTTRRGRRAWARPV